MKKILNIILILSVTIACSTDNSDDNNSEQNKNGFTFNNSFFDTKNVYINDENVENSEPSDIAIVMSNVDIINSNQNSGVNFVYFDFKGIEIEEGTINEIPDYRILTNASLNNGQIVDGTVILDDSTNETQAISASVKIITVSNSEIEFEFSFTNENGEVINGNYSGSFTNISQS